MAGMKKIRPRKNFLHPMDWILLAVLAAVITSGVYLVWRERPSVRSTTEIRYTVLVSGADSTLYGDTGRIPVGAAVASENGTTRLGTVTSVAVRPHLSAGVKNGRVVFPENPDKIDLLVTVRAEATEKKGDGLRVGDIRVAAGGTGGFRFGTHFFGDATVIFLEEVKR